MKSSIRLLLLLTFLTIIFTISNVFAKWYYNEFTDPENISLFLQEFLYAPEEILPGTEEDSKLETNHQAILQEILYSKKYGLNPANVLHSNMSKYGDMIVCYENGISGGNMNNIPRAGNLGFVLTCTREAGEIVSYYLYTFEEFTEIENGSSIVVYQTLIVPQENGPDKWWAPSSKIGYVVISPDSIGQKKGKYYILPSAWVAGEAPNT